MLRAIKLRTEYLENPLGIDIRRPRFGWNLTGNSIKQTAFEIRAAHTEAELETCIVWSSGKIMSDHMQHHVYGGDELKSREKVYWQVKIWDENDEPGEWSEAAVFEMGLLEQSDWKAQWITGDYEAKVSERYPADEFRKVFNEDLEDMVSARLYISACGIYETYLNGKRVGNQVMTPGLSCYDVRNHYQTYDVTSLLKSGENIWDISLGDGWFRGKMGVFGSTCVYGDTTCVIGQSEIEKKNGTIVTVGTDTNFAWSNDGPVRFNDMKDGETVSGRSVPSYLGKAKLTKWDSILCSANNVPVLEQETFVPEVLKTPDGSTVLDFGQNLAGYMAFSIHGTKGHTARMQMGEMLDEEGNFTVRNLITEDTSPDFIPDYCDDTRFQTVVYICGSSEREYWKPKFCVQGFRYVKLENWPEEVKPEHFQAIAVYSDMDVTAKFSCSSSDVEQLVKNTLWSMKGNFLDVPTDCPTRERAPWLGDAQLFFDTGCYLMDFTAFFQKWMRDVFDDQAPDGKVYNIVPRGAAHGGMNEFVEGSSGWTDAGILIPYRYWKHFGDIQMIQDHYNSMKRLAEFMISRMGDTSDPELDQKLVPSEYRRYIVTTGFHFGEWNEPGSSPTDVVFPKFEEATAYLIYSLRCMSEMAEAIGEKADAERYGDISKKAKRAYQFYFIKNDRVESKRMCQYVRPLALKLINDQSAKNVQDGLKNMVEESNYHVGTGFLSTPFVLNMLSEAGDTEAAYKMLENEEYPSWIYEIKQGATTVWENWDGVASRNHYSNGACCDWIFNTVCGIRVAGENRFEIAPVPGGSLTEASLEYQSLYGKVCCAWEKDGEQIRYTVEIPVGCEAKIRIEKCGTYEREAGKYTFVI